MNSDRCTHCRRFLPYRRPCCAPDNAGWWIALILPSGKATITEPLMWSEGDPAIADVIDGEPVVNRPLDAWVLFQDISTATDALTRARTQADTYRRELQDVLRKGNTCANGRTTTAKSESNSSVTNPKRPSITAPPATPNTTRPNRQRAVAVA